jgi:hypothetical protein
MTQIQLEQYNTVRLSPESLEEINGGFWTELGFLVGYIAGTMVRYDII